MAVASGDSTKNPLDLVVIGAGINGAGIAADASGRGLSTLLVEMQDLASATSSASSKLIHGGLRYLEHYEFRLVREALEEREVLLNKAGHLVKPMRFQMPHRPHLRPAWMIRIGLFMYDNLGKRVTLPGSRGVRYDVDSPLKSNIKRGFEYSDCWVDDARLVVANALQVKENDGEVLNRTRCNSARRVDGLWQVELEDLQNKSSRTVYCKSLVNAAGPWVASLIKEGIGQKPRYGIRMIKGSHIVVPKIHDRDNAFIMQNEDKRIVFVIPYLDQYSLIGTTDVEYQGNPSTASIDEKEVDYLLKVTNQHFQKQISRQDILWSFSGVRPLCDDESNDPSAITRDYTLDLNDEQGKAPLLSVFGGKLTTYRKLAEAAMTKLKPYLPAMGPSWSAKRPLPGGEFKGDFEAFLGQLQSRFGWVPAPMLKRLARAYGARIEQLLENKSQLSDLGQHFGADFYAAEVDFLVQTEWALSLEDILWRRTKQGLALSKTEQGEVDQYLKKFYSIGGSAVTAQVA